MITQEFLQNKFNYIDGKLFYKSDKRAGTLGTMGYRNIKIKNKLYYEHRIIWCMLYGQWPNKIDHINGIRDDNRIQNLRNVTNKQNSQNLKVSIRNKSGSRIPGVYYNKGIEKYIVLLAKDYKRYYGGLFDTLYEAEMKCFSMRKQLFPFDNCERFLI